MIFTDTNRKKIYWYLIAAIFSLHLFFVNIKSSHDWGDDFAQYIHQAKNIVEGKSQLETGYIYNVGYPLLGPPAYAIGFPVLLAPVYAIAGNNIRAFNYLISAFLFLSVILSFGFFRKYFKPFHSFLLVLILSCNPLMLSIKSDIASDIPFTFFLLLLILIYLKPDKKYFHFVLLGLLTGFLVSLRSIGLAFLIAVVINEYINFRRNTHSNRKNISAHLAIYILCSISFFVLINQLIFHLPLRNFRYSAEQFNLSIMYDTVLRNLNYYFVVFQNLFGGNPENKYIFFSTFLKSVVFTLVLLGFVSRLKKEISFVEILLLIFALM